MKAPCAGAAFRWLGLHAIRRGAQKPARPLRAAVLGSDSLLVPGHGRWWRCGAAASSPILVILRAFVLALVLAPVARAQDVPLVAALSSQEVRISTAFTGESIMVFGSTDQPIGPGGDEIIVVARGPTRPLVVRRKVRALIFWVNGPSARFAQAPGFYAIAGTRPAWQLLPEEVRQRNGLGLDALPLASTGARSGNFRAALLDLRKADGLWLEDAAPVEIRGNRLFNIALPLPATVPTGDYRVEVLLVRSRRIAARQELTFRVERIGTADRIATVAQNYALLYGAVCILLAAFAGWLGSVLFRRD